MQPIGVGAGLGDGAEGVLRPGTVLHRGDAYFAAVVHPAVAVGDMQRFMQYQAAQAMRDAAQQEGGGLVGAGMGLGAGAGLGAMMGQTMAQAMQSGQQSEGQGATPSVPDIMTLSEAAAYMRVGEEDVLEVIKSGELKAKKIGTSYRISKQAIDEFLSS